MIKTILTSPQNGESNALPSACPVGAEANQNPALESKTGHDPISERATKSVRPSPENDKLYKPVNTRDASFKALVASVREHGILEPLVLTLDGFILSGHRRFAAARVARLATVPVRYRNIRRGDGTGQAFLEALREFNRQRVKSIDEQLREAIVDADPEEAYSALLEHRVERALVNIETLAIEGEMKRSRLTAAKEPMLLAIERVLRERRKFWPLSDRSVHYALLNIPPLIHAKKADSIYQNNLKSYKALTELLTRARLTGRVPMQAIADTTRPVSVWDVHDSPATFFDRELQSFLKGYRRNLQQSQPLHLEIVGEKLTVQSTLAPVASRYNIPLTIGRGFSSLEPRFKMAQRFKRSGKEKMCLIVLSDFDPSGEEICQSFARSLRDDFGVRGIELLKVAISADHVSRFNLPPMMQAKESDSRARKFTEKHGSDVYELEALAPEVLQSELRAAIDSVMDIKAFNQELDAEKADAAYLATLRQRAHLALKEDA